MELPEDQIVVLKIGVGVDVEKPDPVVWVLFQVSFDNTTRGRIGNEVVAAQTYSESGTACRISDGPVGIRGRR